MSKTALEYPALKPLISVAQAAAYCGVCRRTVERLISAGKLPRVRVGSRVLVHAGDLQRLTAPELTATTPETKR